MIKLWAAFINPVVHQSSRYELEPIVWWLQQWAVSSSETIYTQSDAYLCNAGDIWSLNGLINSLN